ncbi:acyl-CoA dehydrogenase [Paracoccus limosus]|uniref:Acyl-CoA dehydrogenase n=1 Tax=Paracoccus limosus TaxID=913252 RepID=A0A844HAU1_9RHOB|nr:acyl-CoA dehydrogenase family protein [Paracoccus limosus]MTH35938.1 acyl-CoA dehydrogenase [Paracoccus limosus]
MIPFQAPVEDILFSLNVAGAARLPGWDDDLVREVVTQFARFAEGVLAPVDEAGDRQGCTLDAGRVRMPAGMVRAYADFTEQGWHALALPEAAGGQAMPGPVLSAVDEIHAGASHALQMITALVPGAARTIAHFGTGDQQARWLPRLGSGDWLATMALTEAGAGSDLSGIRCRAHRDGAGWRVEGEKIFISGGDQDLTPRILHLVLARTGAAGSGTRGLSLFLVPSHDDTGARAPISTTRIEEKLGLHASPTCQMLYDGAPAELLGREGEGLRAMFVMMNHARLDVSLQGVAHAARASHIARTYAATRRQGRAPGHEGAAPIAAHADVRRMLDRAEALALGCRTLSHVAAVTLEAGDDPALVEMLTPVCKWAGTRAGIEAADLGIQILGGYGYLREYRIEQVWRDARITAIYEGANGIHAQTLALRLLRLPGAAEAFAAFLTVPEAAALWQQARAQVLAMPDPAPLAHDFMALTAEAALATIWRRLDAAAEHAPDARRLRALARREALLRPVRLRHHAGMVAALAGA